MSAQHPIIAITGSSGAGTTSVRDAFEYIFRKNKLKAAIVEGDGFHKYCRKEMDELSVIAKKAGTNLTHFGPEGNLLDELEDMFAEYSEKGTGKRRFYVHNEKEALLHGAENGALTPWEPLEENTDLMFYEGLHGGVITDEVNVAQYVDLLVGVTPIINLEWMQKIHRDKEIRGYSVEDSTTLILDRMYDYIRYITPQFSRTDINFQRVPTIDTSNPFKAGYIPNNEESFTVIHIRNHEKIRPDFRYLLELIKDAVMSTPDTVVVPAGKTTFAIQLILSNVFSDLIAKKEKPA